jgi:hypothetical protein
MIDRNTYETNPIYPTSEFEAGWIPYPSNVTLNVDFSSVVGAPRRVVGVDQSIGISDHPNGENFTNIAGALVEYQNVSGTGFQAVNTTCGDYFARFVVHFAPLDEGADGGTDAFEAGADDGTVGRDDVIDGGTD